MNGLLPSSLIELAQNRRKYMTIDVIKPKTNNKKENLYNVNNNNNKTELYFDSIYKDNFQYDCTVRAMIYIDSSAGLNNKIS